MEAEHKKEVPEGVAERKRVICSECDGGGVVQDPLCGMSGSGLPLFETDREV